MRNPYFVLGVQPDASQNEVKSAFRRLAMAFHPDHNHGDFGAQERFAEINAAYQILGDPRKRQWFDDGVIDARGKRRPAGTSGKPKDPFAGVDVNRREAEPSTGESAENIAASIFGEAFQREKPQKANAAPASGPTRREKLGETPGIDEVPLGGAEEPAGGAPQRMARGWNIFDRAIKPLINLIGGRDGERDKADTHVDLSIDLHDILTGGHYTVALSDGSEVGVAVASGTPDRHVMRLGGLGEAREDGVRGDVVVTVRYARHPRLRPDGDNLHVEVPLGLDGAVFGTSATVPTLDGEVTIGIPAWSGSDRKITVAGKGLPTPEGGFGDLVAEIRVMLSEEPDEKLIDLLRLKRGEWYI